MGCLLGMRGITAVHVYSAPGVCVYVAMLVTTVVFLHAYMSSIASKTLYSSSMSSYVL